MRFAWLFLIVAVLAVGPFTADSVKAQSEESSIVDRAGAAGSFETLVALLEAAGLTETLANDGPFTVFAPTDDAFAALPEDTIQSLLEDPSGALTDILLYHVVSGDVRAADVVALDGSSVQTLEGSALAITVDGESVMVNDANVIQVDIGAANGVIHVVDTVLIPATDATDDQSPETMAPTEESTEEATAPAAAGEKDIVDTAVAAGDFSTLVAAVQAAGLEETLRGEGPFTVFAPTDAAFSAVPAYLLDALLAEPQGALTDILLYHVVAGQVLAEDVAGLDGMTVETVGGESFTVTVSDAGIFVDDARVVVTDIAATNGVIHVVDTVLIPPSVAAALASTTEAAAQEATAEPTSVRQFFPRPAATVAEKSDDTKRDTKRYQRQGSHGYEGNKGYGKRSHHRDGKYNHSYGGSRYRGSYCR